jgi:hypothetical protein
MDDSLTISAHDDLIGVVDIEMRMIAAHATWVHEWTSERYFDVHALSQAEKSEKLRAQLNLGEALEEASPANFEPPNADGSTRPPAYFVMKTTVVRLGPDVRQDPVHGFLKEGDVVELQSHRPAHWRPGDAEEWSVLQMPDGRAPRVGEDGILEEPRTVWRLQVRRISGGRQGILDSLTGWVTQNDVNGHELLRVIADVQALAERLET